MTLAMKFQGRGRLSLLLAIFAAVAGLWYWDPSSMSVVQPVAVQRQTTNPVPKAPAAPLLDKLSPSLLAVVPRAVASAAEPVSDLFVARSWARPTPRALASVQVAPTEKPESGAPAVPEPPFILLGKQFAGGQWKVFLTDQSRTLVVGVGDTLGGVWRVERIDPPSMLMLHVPSSQQRIVRIGDGL